MMLNKLLKRQIQKHLGKEEDVPKHLSPFLGVISESYDHYEKDRNMLERSIELSSKEMIELHDRLRQETHEVKKAHSELHRILNNVKEVVFSLNMITYQYIFISASCEKVYGYSADEFQKNQMLWKDVIHPDDAAAINPHDEKLYQGEELHLQYRIIHKDKSTRWLDAIVIPTLDEAGKLVILDVVVNDITESKTTRQKLEEANEQLNRLFNNINEVLYSVDMVSYQLIQMSATCEKVYGYTSAEFLSRPDLWKEVIYPEDQHIERESTPLLFEGKEVLNQYRIVHKNGQVRWIENSIIPTLDENGKLIRLDGVTKDISEKKAGEQKLLESQKRYRMVYENPFFGIALGQLNGRIENVNDAFCHILGYSQEEIAKMNFSELTPPEDAELELCFIRKMEKGEIENYQLQKRYRTKAGKIIWAELSMSCAKNPLGEIQFVAAVIQDITSEKQLAIEREKITSDLTQQNKNLGQFAYIVSHNLRAPIAHILGLSVIINDPHIEARAFQKCLDGFVTAASKLDEVIIDLNEILQVQGQINEKREMVALSDLVSDIKMNMDDIMGNENGFLIKTDFSSVEKLFTLKSYMHSIFFNLISNSLKYRKAGEKPVIEISSLKRDNKVALIFKDNGEGIDLAVHGDKIFGLYKRFSQSAEGKGMGLFMVKTQVETLQGQIKVKSEINKGTEFILEFEQ